MLQQHGKSAYLDGIRGVAAFGVFLNHFSLAFYSAWFTRKATTSHLGGYELQFSSSPFSFLINGAYFVAIFFVLSGFVLSRKYFRTADPEVLVSGMNRRFIRLYIPIAFTLLLSWFLMSNHLYYNTQASVITLSDWFSRLWRFTDPDGRLLASITYGTMFYGDASFDTCLWTISYELFGSYMVFLFLLLTHYTRKFRLPLLLLAIAACFALNSPFYLSFFLGITLCYTEQWADRQQFRAGTIVALMLIACSLLLGSLPYCTPIPGSWQDTIKNTIWDYTPWCLPAAAYLLVLAYIIAPPLQRLTGALPFRFLGYISFSLYLLHPILIGSYGAWLFLKLYETWDYNHSVFFTFLAIIALLLPVSWLMARFVDQLGITIAQNFYVQVKKVIYKRR